VFRVTWVVLLLCLCAGCAQRPRVEADHLSWSRAMHHKLENFSWYSQEKLKPYFARANLPYAPKELAFVVFKKSRRFVIYARSSQQAKWRFIRTYPIQAASGGPGPKLNSGDYQVPEGVYHIVGMNPRSRFDLSLELNYPNHFDKAEAKVDHRSNLGGNIFIHGGARSVGCIALGNDAIEQLFPLVYAVGEKHVVVVIAPDDLRKEMPLPVHRSVHWLPSLYARLKAELAAFPAV
jgi:hypothetical protein